MMTVKSLAKADTASAFFGIVQAQYIAGQLLCVNGGCCPLGTVTTSTTRRSPPAPAP